MLATYCISIEHQLSFCLHFNEVSKMFSNYLSYCISMSLVLGKKISFLFRNERLFVCLTIESL